MSERDWFKQHTEPEETPENETDRIESFEGPANIEKANLYIIGRFKSDETFGMSNTTWNPVVGEALAKDYAYARLRLQAEHSDDPRRVWPIRHITAQDGYSYICLPMASAREFLDALEQPPPEDEED
jgi:hypothetical protein